MLFKPFAQGFALILGTALDHNDFQILVLRGPVTQFLGSRGFHLFDRQGGVRLRVKYTLLFTVRTICDDADLSCASTESGMDDAILPGMFRLDVASTNIDFGVDEVTNDKSGKFLVGSLFNKVQEQGHINCFAILDILCVRYRVSRCGTLMRLHGHAVT